jgi:hypothetical protein
MYSRIFFSLSAGFAANPSTHLRAFSPVHPTTVTVTVTARLTLPVILNITAATPATTVIVTVFVFSLCT